MTLEEWLLFNSLIEIPSTPLTVFTNSIFVKRCKMYNTIDVKIRYVEKLSKFVFNLRHSLTDIFRFCKPLF
jgi:hypothetical protein